MKVEGDLWVNICGRKAPTGYTTEDWDELVMFVREGSKYLERHLLEDADFDPGESEINDIYHHVNNSRLLLGKLNEKVK